MNKILLITTDGCIACEIMANLLHKVVKEGITFECENFKNLPKKFMEDNHIEDFPTTLFIVDDKVKSKIIGTATITAIKKCIE